MKNAPHSLTTIEWDELAKNKDVRELWALAPHEAGEYLAKHCYGVRFDFESGSPGYCGDLYFLQGDALDTVNPAVFIRRAGELDLLRDGRVTVFVED